MKIIGQHWKHQKNSSIRYCCHICQIHSNLPFKIAKKSEDGVVVGLLVCA
jgi:hypothetical protein